MDNACGGFAPDATARAMVQVNNLQHPCEHHGFRLDSLALASKKAGWMLKEA